MPRFTRFLLIPFLLAGGWLISCNTAPEEVRQAFAMEHPEDLLGYDRVVIALEDTNGQAIETLYDGKPVSEDEFAELIPKVFAGGPVVVRIEGFTDGKTVYAKTVTYDTDTDRVLDSRLLQTPGLRLLLRPGLVSVAVGDTFALPAVTFDPPDIAEQAVTLSLGSDGRLKQGDGAASGKLVALAAGETSVRLLWIADPSVTAAFTVRIRAAGTEDTVPFEDPTLAPTSLAFDSDTIRVYLGAATQALPLTAEPAGASRSVETNFSASGIASLIDGKLTGMGEGRTRLTVRSTLAPGVEASAVVAVKRDVPVWRVPRDTTVGAGLSALLRFSVAQEFGGLTWVAWDADGDGTWDDSTGGLEAEVDLRLTWAESGDYTLRLAARDAEGNVSDTSVLVHAVPAPDIRIVSPQDSSFVNTRTVPVSWTVDGEPQTEGLTETLATEGLNLIRRSANGPGGAPFDAVVRVYLDTTPPAPPVFEGDTVVNTAQPLWRWSPGSTAGGDGRYLIGLDGKPAAEGNPVTAAEFRPESPLPEGEHTLYVQALDAAGNASPTSAFPVTIDLTAPAKPTLVSREGPVTGNRRPTFAIRPQGGGAGIFRFRLDDANFASADAGTADTLFTPASELDEGSHTLYAQERDRAGNWSPTAEVTVQIDATAPGAPVVKGNTPTNDSTPTWTWSGSGSVGTGAFRYRLGNPDLSGETPSPDTSFTLASPATKDTALTLYVQERDGAGNWSAVSAHAIRIDLTPPPKPKLSGGSVSNNPRPTWLWSGDSLLGSGTFRIRLDNADLNGAAHTTGKSYTPAVDLADGSHTLYVQERDSAGNWSSSGTFTTRVDATPPKAPGFTSVLKSPLNNLRPTWSWGPGGGGNGTYRYKLDSPVLTTGASTNTLTEFTPTQFLAEGAHTLYVQEADSAGNYSPVSQQTVVVGVAGLAGSAGFSPIDASQPAIAVNASGVPYVAFRDDTDSGKATVMRLNGSAWQVVGNAHFSRGGVGNLTMAFGPNDVPYVSFTETHYSGGGVMYSGTVMRLSGSTWQMVGGGSFDPAGAMSMAFGPDGSLYAAYARVFTDAVGVRRLNAAGTGWDEVGGNSVNVNSGFGMVNRLVLAVGAGGRPHFAYATDETTSNAAVMRLNAGGTGWEMVGGGYVSTGSALFITLAVHPDGNPWVAFRDESGNFGTTVRRLNGSAWQTVGTAGFSGTSIGSTSYQVLRFNAAGKPFVGFIDAYRTTVATVATLNAAGTDWEFIRSFGQPGTETPADYDMALSPAGIPYLVFSNSDDGGRLSAYRATFEP